MDAEQLLSLVFGVSLVALGVGLVARLWPRREPLTCFISYTLVGIAFVLWTPQTSWWLDRTSGVAGLAALLWACSATLGIGLQFVFICQLYGRMGWVRVSPALCLGLVALYTAAWSAVRLTTGADAERLLNPGYHGDRPALLAWNLVVSLSGLLVCTVAAREILRVEHIGHVAWLAAGVYMGGVAYDLLVAGQAVASHLGYGADTIVPLIHAIRITAMVGAAAAVSWTVIGIDLWTIERLRRRVRRLTRQRADLIFLLVILSDRFVDRLAPHEYQTVQHFVEWCAQQRSTNLQPRQMLIALQATRRIAWRRGALVAGQWNDADAADKALADRSIVAEAALDIAAGASPISDIGQVIRLALPGIPLPAWLGKPLPMPTPTHIAAAALLAQCANVKQRTLPADSLFTQERMLPANPDKRPLHWISSWLPAAWHRNFATRHMQVETDIMICCELIEDYLVQLDAPDDEDLAVITWDLGRQRGLSPLQLQVGQRASQILALFGVENVRATPVTRDGRGSYALPRSPSEIRVALWCQVATVVRCLLTPASIPIDAMLQPALHGRVDGQVAALIQQAARAIRQTHDRRAERVTEGIDTVGEHVSGGKGPWQKGPGKA